MSILRRTASGVSAVILTLSSLMTLGLTGVAHAAAPQTCDWVGGTNTDMNTASNWSNCGGGTPGAGDIIAFTTAPSGGTAVKLTNDLGVTLGGVQAGYTSSDGSYEIDQISLADGAVISFQQQTVCDTWQIGMRIDSVTSTGSITDDAGALVGGTVNVTGNLTLGYSNLYTQSGSSVGGGVILAQGPATELSGCGVEGAGGGMESGPSITGFTINSLTVQNGMNVQLGNASFPITLGGGSGSGTPELLFFAALGINNNYAPTTYTVSSAITLLSNAEIYAGQNTTVNVTGSISGAGYSITRDTSSDHSGVLNIKPSSNTSSTKTGSLTNPATTITITDSQPTADVDVVDNQTTVLDGVRRYVNVENGGVLKGTGSTQTLYVLQGGTVAPGHSPGTLTVTSNLHLLPGSTYRAEIKSKKAGDFDQIVAGSASDTDTTYPDVVLGDGSAPDGYPTLAVSLYKGYSIKAGDQFEIIDNLSKTPVSGQFVNLPEGATFKVDNGVFKITYKGGDGNDVVLTAVTAPTAPDTGFGLVAAHPTETLALTVIAAGLIFGFAQRTRRAPARAKVSHRR